MLDYIVNKLEHGNGETIIPRSKEIVSGIVSNYILIGSHKETRRDDKDGIILLIDKIYPKNSFNEIYEKVSDIDSLKGNIGVVIFKDGKTFFRNASEKNYFKKKKKLSLKNYTDDEMHKMILFRPEEIFLSKRKEWLQYYQENSSLLKEGIVSFKFSPVIFDYNHIDSMERFKPNDVESERLHIWKKRIFHDGPIELKDGYLKRIKRIKQITFYDLWNEMK